MRFMTCIETFEVSLLVDFSSTYNFINTNITEKVGLKGYALEPFMVRVASGEKLMQENSSKCKEKWLTS